MAQSHSTLPSPPLPVLHRRSPYMQLQQEAAEAARQLIGGAVLKGGDGMGMTPPLSGSHSMPQLGLEVATPEDRAMQGQQAGGGSSMVLSAGSATTLEPLRRECIEAIEARELLLRRLYGISLSPEQAPGMVRLLRAAALRVVECIATWHRGVRAAMDDPDDPAVGARFDASSMPAACCLLSVACSVMPAACSSFMAL